MPETKNIVDKMNELLFDSVTESVGEHEQQMIVRYRDAYTYWLENPLSSDSEIRDYLMSNYKISKSQSYRDIINIKLLLGNVREAGKEWHRHRVNFLLEKAAKMALEGQTKEATAISKVAMALIKNNKLNIDEGEELPYDEIVPPAFEPVSDPAAIGLKPVEDLREKITKLKEKYTGEIEITDIQYEDINERETAVL
ncbi:MAG: hypothetical protein LBP85_07000 [Prevotellaceae bacterium]|jgi:tryptophan 2,3-dioxygenase|nr:hypothetical protein [Prevotellaceae bacterium]